MKVIKNHVLDQVVDDYRAKASLLEVVQVLASIEWDSIEPNGGWNITLNRVINQISFRKFRLIQVAK